MGNRGEGGGVREGRKYGREEGGERRGEGGVREGRKFQSFLCCPNTSGSTE